jgi:hypothetical protein
MQPAAPASRAICSSPVCARAVSLQTVFHGAHHRHRSGAARSHEVSLCLTPAKKTCSPVP